MIDAIPLVPRPRSWSAFALALSLLGGCGDSGDDPELVAAEGPALSDPAISDPSATPAPLLVIESDPERVAPVPELVGVETLADSGLQIAYTEPSQRDRVSPSRVGVQWEHMQSCIGIVAPPPLVLVRVDVEPFGRADDVIRDIEGRISASASELMGGVAILQVRDAQFDGSRTDAGFGLLRQIMGRHLWLSAGLLERFYPSECAREEPLGDPLRPTALGGAGSRER